MCLLYKQVGIAPVRLNQFDGSRNGGRKQRVGNKGTRNEAYC